MLHNTREQDILPGTPVNKQGRHSLPKSWHWPPFCSLAKTAVSDPSLGSRYTERRQYVSWLLKKLKASALCVSMCLSLLSWLKASVHTSASTIRVYKEFLPTGFSKRGINTLACTLRPTDNTDSNQPGWRLSHWEEPIRLLSLGVTFMSLFWSSPSHQFLLVVSKLTHSCVKVL